MINSETISQGIAILEKAGALDRTDDVNGSGISSLPTAAPAKAIERAPTSPVEATAPEGTDSVQPWLYSGPVQAAAAHFAGGVRLVQSLQAQINQAASQLPDLERISPTSAIKRREELQAAVAQLQTITGNVIAYGNQVGEAARAEVRAAAVRLIPEWEVEARMDADSNAMIDFAVELGLDEQAIERIAWNPMALSRFHAVWKRTRSLVPPRLRSLKGGKPESGAEPERKHDIRVGGALSGPKIEAAREILKRAGVTP